MPKRQWVSRTELVELGTQIRVIDHPRYVGGIVIKSLLGKGTEDGDSRQLAVVSRQPGANHPVVATVQEVVIETHPAVGPYKTSFVSRGEPTPCEPTDVMASLQEAAERNGENSFAASLIGACLATNWDALNSQY